MSALAHIITEIRRAAIDACRERWRDHLLPEMPIWGLIMFTGHNARIPN